MICIDTGVLIWGIREHRQAGREDMVERCKLLIEDHQSRRIQIMVPSIVLAEYLTDFDEQSQEEQRQIVADNFFVAPFDNHAAWIAAQLFDRARIKAVREHNTPKQAVHADLKIIATAIAHGASRVYTDNLKDFTILSHNSIQITGIPELPVEPPKEKLLFEEEELQGQ